MKKTTTLIIVGGALSFLTVVAFYFWPESHTGKKQTLKVARCVGYCNLPLFVASETEDASIEIDLQYIPNPGDHGRALISPNGPIASVTPFTNVIVARWSGMKVKIIAGSGMNGLAIVGLPEVKSVADLKGKKIGTFRADTLEAMAYSALSEAGIVGDVSFVYFADALEPLTALRNGEVDAITHVEPFVSQLLKKDKMTLLVRGEDVWKTDHPDCVLVSTDANIKSHREELKQLILLLVKSQQRIENSLEEVAEEVARPYYNMDADELVLAVRSQFPAVDIRGKVEFVTKQANSLKRLGYIDSTPIEKELFDLSLLSEVINENPEVFSGLQHRYPE
jgi:NitT/TauT family transport system substrate-binding protein